MHQNSDLILLWTRLSLIVVCPFCFLAACYLTSPTPNSNWVYHQRTAFPEPVLSSTFLSSIRATIVASSTDSWIVPFPISSIISAITAYSCNLAPSNARFFLASQNFYLRTILATNPSVDSSCPYANAPWGATIDFSSSSPAKSGPPGCAANPDFVQWATFLAIVSAIAASSPVVVWALSGELWKQSDCRSRCGLYWIMASH